MWPFRRHKRAGRGGRNDATGDIVSWAQRTLNDPVYGIPPVTDPLDSPTDVSDTAADRLDWRGSVQDPSESVWGPTHHEVATARDGEGAQAEPSTTVVVVTTQSPEASEGEAHIFADAQEAKLFVERLIDDGFDRERIKTIRGGPAHFNLSFRAVVDFD
jgi:hypothetical protein